MKAPDVADNEAARLKDLTELGILDSQPDARLDRLTRSLSSMFDVPIALITLVDANRQWFKSRFGLNVEETQRDVSFCGHTILGTDAFVVEDARNDDRFFDNPLVTGSPYIAFYAGFPIYSKNEEPIGSLCIIDNKPRQFSEDQQALLKSMAEIVENELSEVYLSSDSASSSVSGQRAFHFIADYCLGVLHRENRVATLVSFEVPRGAGNHKVDRLVSSLRNTFRHSDLIGWTGPSQLSLLVVNSNEVETRHLLGELPDLDSTEGAVFETSVIEIQPNKGVRLIDLLN